MTPRRGQAAIIATPVLVGTVTVLVALVAVFLAYNANTGLPFVPTYGLTAHVPDASELVPGNEVRVGGSRVGQVSAIHAVTGDRGEETAALELELEKAAGPLPRDTRLLIRQRSNLGLKYVELVPGRSRQTIPNGGTLSRSAALPAVDLDDVLNVFDRETRAGTRSAVEQLGLGLAGRGGDLNTLLAQLPVTMQRLAPVARNLRDPRTELGAAIAGVRSATQAVAPVSDELAGLFDAGATTFAALASERRALADALREAPLTEAVGARALHTMRPVLEQGAALARELRPGVRALPAASDQLAAALETGTPVLGLTEPLADRLDTTLVELRRLMREPATAGALTRLREVVAPLRRLLDFANPFQTRCNYLGLWVRNIDGVISQGDRQGNWFRAIVMFAADENPQTGSQAPNLHVNPYPDEGQDGECEAGNEVYLPGRHIGPVPGRQPGFTEDTAPPPGTPDPPPHPTR